MKNTRAYRMIVALVVVTMLVGAMAQVALAATYTEGFDTMTNWTCAGSGCNSYDNHTYANASYPQVTFSSVLSFRETPITQDGYPATHGGSAYAWRLRNVLGSTWQAKITTGGVGTFSVWVRRWDGSPDVSFDVEYSTNNGGSWTLVQTVNGAWLGSSDWKQVNGTINTSNGAGDSDDILIRIQAKTAGERLMVDDFEMTDYAGGSDPAPTVSSHDPDVDATGVAQASNIEITFSEDVTVSSGWYDIDCTVSGANRPATVTGGPQIYTLNPDNDFSPSDVCTVTIDAAKVEDSASQPMAANYQWSFTVASGGGAACSTELFISEYIEGSSYNKAIEIVNVTSANVNLSGYQLKIYYNGATSASTTISLAGTVTPGDVFVLCHSSADAGILAVCDQTSGSLTFNGDDAVEFLNGSIPLDVIGEIGYDPGTEWGTGLVSTADNTLRRMDTVTAGDPDGDGDFNVELPLEWDGFATDTFSDLGSHTVDCVDTPPQVSGTSPSNGATGVSVNTTATIDFSENVTTSGTWYNFTCDGSPVTSSASGSNSQRIITPDSALPFDASCTVTVLAAQVTDLDGTADPMASNYVLDFTTAADNLPTVNSTTPANGATGVALTANIVVNFSEMVTVTDPWFTISCASGTRFATVTGGPQSYTLDPSLDFTSGDFCTVTIQASQVVDQDGIPNPMATSYIFTFLTADGTGGAPTGLGDYERWFGSQHAHTTMDNDDGQGNADQAFAYADNIPHLQYFIITPHVHVPVDTTSLTNPSTYLSIRDSAATATTSSFIAIAGQEVSSISSGGHWNLFNAADMITDHPNGDWTDADNYYDHVVDLANAGEVIAAQFNHPTTGDFGNYYDPAAGPYFGTFAVSSGYTGATNQDFSNNGSNLEYMTTNPYENLWAHYLDLGWKVSPAADQDNHQATWGASSSEYTVIVRPAGTILSTANVLNGLTDHMTYATEDANMQIGFTANGWSMGQTIGGDSNVSFTIWWNNPSETLYNNNIGGSVTEPANDVIQNIWIYQNVFNTVGDSVGANSGTWVARLQPGTASGTWNVTLPATAGDWFVVKFQDTYTFATDPTYGRTTSKDLTWSAPVWYDPPNADTPLSVGTAGIYVDDDYTTSTAGWGVSRFASIQDGINAAVAGQTVYVETFKAGDEAYTGDVVLNKAITVLVEGSLTLNGSLTISNGTFELKGGGTYAVTGNFTHNGGTFSQSSGTILFNGSGTSLYSGLSTTTFYNLTIGPATVLDLGTSPQFNINGTLTNNGWMRQVRDVPAGQTTSFLNISTDKYYGVDITPTSDDMGQTVVLLRGNGGCTNGVASSMLRCFDITPEMPQVATILFYYRDAEENGQTSAYIWHWNSTSSIWEKIETGRIQDTTGVENNWVQAIVSSYSPFSPGNGAPTAISLASFSVHPAPSAALPLVALVGAAALAGAVLLRRRRS